MHLQLRIPCYAAGLLFLMQIISGCASSQQSQQSSPQNSTTASQNSPSGSAEQIVLAIGGESEDGYNPTLG